MNFKSIRWFLTLLLTVVASANAWAASTITCGIPPGTVITYATTFDYTPLASNSTSRTVPISCTRVGNSGNDESLVVTVNIGNSNAAPSTIQNTAKKASVPSINYDFYTTTPCTGVTSTNALTRLMLIQGKEGTTTEEATFFGCVPTPAAGSGGHYLDTATVSITGVTRIGGGGSTLASTATTGSISVDIFVPEKCVLTMPSGDLSLSYTAFGSAVNQSKSFSAVCGTSLAPVMTLTDAIGAPLAIGVAAGLNYTLGLNTASSGGSGTLTVAPTGSVVNYYINATIAAGQAGSCALPATNNGTTCTETKTHYVTITW